MEARLMSKTVLYEADYNCTKRSFKNEKPPFLHYHDFMK